MPRKIGSKSEMNSWIRRVDPSRIRGKKLKGTEQKNNEEGKEKK